MNQDQDSFGGVLVDAPGQVQVDFDRDMNRHDSFGRVDAHVAEEMNENHDSFGGVLVEGKGPAQVFDVYDDSMGVVVYGTG